MEYRSPNSQEEKLKSKAAQSLESDRVRLLMDQPFVGAILIRQNLIPVVDSRCPTACTDGQNIFVNPEFYLAMSPAERRFLLAHEVWHTVYLHFLRSKGWISIKLNGQIEVSPFVDLGQLLLAETRQIKGAK